jgi:hypothetical protein
MHEQASWMSLGMMVTLGVDGGELWCCPRREGRRGEPQLVSYGGKNSGALETEIGLEVLSNLTVRTLEGQLADVETQWTSGSCGGSPRNHSSGPVPGAS